MGKNDIFFNDVEVGYKIKDLIKSPINETQLVMYAGASGDFNPIHTVHAFGKKAGFGGVIGHGMLTMGFVGQFITNWVGVKSLKKLAVQFKAITKPKDVITVSGEVTKKYSFEEENRVDCEIIAKNQNNEIVIAGSATVALP